MNMGLDGKTVIVTGASSNIGRGIALEFAREKANVVIADIDVEGAEKVANLCKSEGAPRTAVVRTDVTKWEDAEALMKKTIADFGRVDVLVNNVGFANNIGFIEKDRADSIVFGGEPQHIFADVVRQRLDEAGYSEIPIICGISAGVAMAKAMVNMKLVKAPRAYPSATLKAKPEYW